MRGFQAGSSPNWSPGHRHIDEAVLSNLLRKQNQAPASPTRSGGRFLIADSGSLVPRGHEGPFTRMCGFGSGNEQANADHNPDRPCDDDLRRGLTASR